MLSNTLFRIPVLLVLGLALAGCPKTTEEVVPEGTPVVLKDDVNRGDIIFPSVVKKEKNSCFESELLYPFTGRSHIDNSIEKYVQDVYAGPARDFGEYCAQKNSASGSYQIHLDYEAYSPSANIISILYHPWMYSGGAHGLGQLHSSTYRVADGKVLQLENIFARPAGLLEFFSDYTRKSLRPKLGQYWEQNEMFEEGLAPEIENFNVFVLKKGGLELRFPVYQIAPYSEGEQSCFIPLDELATFRPRPNIWH